MLKYEWRSHTSQPADVTICMCTSKRVMCLAAPYFYGENVENKPTWLVLVMQQMQRTPLQHPQICTFLTSLCSSLTNALSHGNTQTHCIFSHHWSNCPWIKAGLGNILSSVSLGLGLVHITESVHSTWSADLNYALLPEQRLIPLWECLCLAAALKLFKDSQSLIAHRLKRVSHPCTSQFKKGLCKLLKLLNCPSSVKVLKCSCNNLPVRICPD